MKVRKIFATNNLARNCIHYAKDFGLNLGNPKIKKLRLSKFDKYQNEKMNFPRKTNFVKPCVFNFIG